MAFKLHTSPRGFTLIELLVVVFIISLTAGILLINVSFGTAEDKIKEEAFRLQSLLRFAQEQSVIRAEEYGVRFHQTGYRFMTLIKDRWTDLAGDRHLKSRELENNMEFELYIEDIDVVLNNARDEARLIKEQLAEEKENSLNNNINNNNNNIYNARNRRYINNVSSIIEEQKIKPQIFLLSSGELSPNFSARLRIPGEELYFEVQGSLNGQYKLVKSDE